MKSNLVSLLCLVLSGSVFAQDIEQLEQEALFAAASAAAPYVVKVEAIGGAEKVGRQLVSSAPTSGIIVDSDGFIASSAYAFVKDPNSILVQLPNGKRQRAEIVSRDHRFGLVLLKVEVDEPLDVPVPGNSSSIDVGQWAITVAKTLPSQDFNMSVGIVSAKDRVWGKSIQIDANVSPSNYGGALVGIDGQLNGIIVPMSPNSDEVMAGTEWYDSGIGFAVPLDRVMGQLERWKEGDLHAGKMGIAMKSENLYGDEPVIGVCRPKSPAREADLRKGDRVVSANGVVVTSYAQLKHILGPMLAGETLALEIERGGDVLKKTIELTDKLEPYQHAFLGILPGVEGVDEIGVPVRFVFPNSPADEAGIKAGDLLLQLNSEDVADEQAFRQALAAFEPTQEVEMKYSRDGEVQEVIKIALAEDNEVIPTSLPPRFDVGDAPSDELPAIGKINVKLPEEVNDCVAYVPETYDPRFAHGLLVLLPLPGEKDINDLVREWREACNESRTILLVPQSRDERSWEPSETQFVRKTIENVRKDYEIDSDRIVVCGTDNSGAMAYLVGFTYRDLIRGVAAFNAGIPRSSPAIYNEPLQRLSIWVAGPKEGRDATRIESNVELLRKLKFPVTQTTTETEAFDDDSRQTMLRWMDTLDRL